MKKFSALLVIFIYTLTAQASLSCLTEIPRNNTELESRIRIQNRQLQMAKEAEINFKEIADDALFTRNLSKTVMSASVLGLTSLTLFPFSAKMMAHEGAAVIGFATFWMTVGFDVGIAIEYLSSLRSLSRSEKQDMTHQLLTASQSVNCSYSKSHQFLRERRDIIFKTKLDGSILNTLKDHFSLGLLSQEATAQLYFLAVAERTLIEKEIEDLKILRNVLNKRD